ncbi:hypothetical protein QE152_g35648 [Popillia japonica]|uniref:Uncharacterized protein n=1 Tax=Popillia japonica TaxID=7064 RepID=A0AAW1IFD0_POPJA
MMTHSSQPKRTVVYKNVQVRDYTEDPLDDVCSYGNRNSIPKNEADTTELNRKIEEDLTYEEYKENILPLKVKTLGNILYATATELGATATELGTKILKTVEKKKNPYLQEFNREQETFVKNIEKDRVPRVVPP